MIRSRTMSLAALFAVTTTAAVLSSVAADALPYCPPGSTAPICGPKDPPPPKTTTTKTGSIFPAYVLLTVLYDPPGKGSEVDYAQGSSAGTQFSDQKNFKAGANIQATVGIVTVGGGFNGGPINGTTFTVNKQKDTTLFVTSTQDQMTHDSDVFYIWVNPQIDLRQTTTGNTVSPLSQAITSVGGTPLIVPVTGRELKDLSLLPQYKRDQLKGLKPSDTAQILGLNPLVAGASVGSDPKRYTKQATLQLDGPDQPGDPLTGAGIDVITQQTAGTVDGWSKTATASVGVSTGFSFFGLAQVSLQASATFEWDYQATTQQNTGTTQTAAVKLVTSTVGFHDVIDVYLDKLFNSYVFVSQTGASLPTASASMSGQVKNRAGRPVANEIVQVKLADGSVRSIVTNSRGIYRVFRAPAGPANVVAGGAIRAAATIAADRPSVANVLLDK